MITPLKTNAANTRRFVVDFLWQSFSPQKSDGKVARRYWHCYSFSILLKESASLCNSPVSCSHKKISSRNLPDSLMNTI
jgi:hypothetical protein